MKFQGKLLFGSMAVLGTLFTSCSKETDLYDSDAVMSKLKTEYTSNFVKKYARYRPQSDVGLHFNESGFHLAFNRQFSNACQ